MIGRRLSELGADELDQLPERCRRCLFWELGTPRPIDLQSEVTHSDELAGDPLTQKSAWWTACGLEHGAPGRSVRLGRAAAQPPTGLGGTHADGETAAWSLFGPPAVFARRRPPVPRASQDALFLATVWVEAHARGAGLGRLLVQTAVKEAIRRDLRAVEAYGDRRHRDAACVLPAVWLVHEGFAIHREHPRYPLLRLDVRSVARWTEPLEHAVEAALARLSRRPEPAPAPARPTATGEP